MSQPDTAPDLFDLVLTSGVFRKSGEASVRPEQVGAVEIGEHLG